MAAAVDLRGVVQLPGDRLEKLPLQEDKKRVAEDAGRSAQIAVVPAQLAIQKVLGDHRHRIGQHHGESMTMKSARLPGNSSLAKP
jgi:hypothetical protein